MPGRYSKFYSNYILKKKHQNVLNGTIWERDWVTIGAKHQIEKGKRPFFGDSGFLYTINNVPTTKKKHDYGKWIASWFYDDVETSTEAVNSVEVNQLSSDIRDFVYYGSCYELISASILDIIRKYPPVIISENAPFVIRKEDRRSDQPRPKINLYSPGYSLYNPFNVDFTIDDVKDNQLNLLRFLAISHTNFNIRLKVGEDIYDYDNITEYNIIRNTYIHKQYGVGLTEEKYNVLQPPTDKVKYENIDNFKCEDDYTGANMVDVQIKANKKEDNRENCEIILKGYRLHGELVFCFHSGKVTRKDGSMEYFTMSTRPILAANEPWDLVIHPKKEVIEKFKKNLDPFEKLLLREDTIPFYKNTFLTPYETESGMHYVYMDYIWPTIELEHVGNVLDISSPVYYNFIERISQLGSSLDELWTDNLWRNMTHESIKNYDWTYRRMYQDGDEEENVVGGLRMEHVIRVYGRFFDDLKRYVDGIKLSNRVTYDGKNNRPDAELSDKLDYMGWDVFSTIPTTRQIDEETNSVVNLTEVTIDNDYLENNGLRWFKGVNCNSITPTFEDNQFMRMLSLSSKYILKSKGTIKSIEMVLALFGLSDVFDITEYYHTIIPHLYDEKEISMINRLNHRVSANYDEDEFFTGLPINVTELYNAKYIVPFYNNKKYYEGEFTFQSNGGWGSDAEEATEVNQYMETLSYLRVVGNIDELLSLNPYDVKVDDIYYVIDLSGIVQYDEDADLSTYSNFFVCSDDVFVDRYSSWKNIVYDEESPDFSPVLYNKAMYLDSIISTDVGNNPHVGYGNYDLGNEYLRYMEYPFTYALDNYSMPDSVREDMENIDFPRIKDIRTIDRRDKCIDLISNSEERDKFFAETVRLRDEKAKELEEKALCVDFGEILVLQNEIADLNAILGTARYYLNSKLFVLTNKMGEIKEETRIDGKTGEEYTYTYHEIPTNYKTYFFNTILPYIMQVIPSTAILILKDFE